MKYKIRLLDGTSDGVNGDRFIVIDDYLRVFLEEVCVALYASGKWLFIKVVTDVAVGPV